MPLRRAAECQRERVEGALQRAHRDGPQAITLVDDLALLGEAQHAVHRARGRGAHQRIDARTAARDAAAARVEDDVAFVGRGERRGEIRLRAVGGEARGADAAFLVGVRITDERALRAAARLEMPPVERIAEQACA